MPISNSKLICFSLSTLTLLHLQAPMFAASAAAPTQLSQSSQPIVMFTSVGPPSVAMLEPEFHRTEASLANAFVDRLRATLFRAGSIKLGERKQVSCANQRTGFAGFFLLTALFK